MASLDDLFRHGWDGRGSGNPFFPFFDRPQGPIPKRDPAAQQRSPRFEARRAAPARKSTSPKGSEGVIDIPITTEEGEVAPRVPRPAPAPAPAKKAKSVPKVVFKSRDDAALKIQAVLRGFLVRRPKPLQQLRLIASVRRKFAAFQERLADPAKMSARERIATSEGAMMLLLELDSIITFEPYVREARRALVRELQRFQDVFDELEAKEKEKEAKEREEKEMERNAKEEEEGMRQEEERAAEEQEVEVTKEESQEQGEEEGFPVDIEIVDAESSHEDDYLIVKREETPGDSMDTETESMIAEEAASGEEKEAKVEMGAIDLTKKLTKDNEELKEMVSKCLDEIHRQNGLISTLGRRMRFLERRLGKRSTISRVSKNPEAV